LFGLRRRDEDGDMSCTEEWRCCAEIKREAKEMEMWVDDLAFEF